MSKMSEIDLEIQERMVEILHGYINHIESHGLTDLDDENNTDPLSALYREVKQGVFIQNGLIK